MNVDKLRKELEEAQDAARETYLANGRLDYDAGRYEGLKQAIEVLDRFRERQGGRDR